jgi:hypothetical protein
MKSPLTQLKERIQAISSGGDEMIKTKDLLDAIDIYLMFEREHYAYKLESNQSVTNTNQLNEDVSNCNDL